MKRKLFYFSVLIVISILYQKAWAVTIPNPLDIKMEDESFYSSLSPHGEWIEVGSGFHVWRPTRMQHSWRPYLLGQWVWTDYGWYWISNEPFGWITYHYGRWYYDDYYGWVWMPDDVWGPAWVEWRYDNDYIGWAPLPPYATFDVSFGMRFKTHWSAPVHYWNFVRYGRFGSVIHSRDIASMEQARRLIRTSRTASQYEINHDRIFNRGIDRAIIEHRGNLRISKIEVRDMHEHSGERFIRSDGNRRTNHIEIYRPTRDEIQRGLDRAEARRGDRDLSIDMKRIERMREHTPQIQKKQSHPNRIEMRRALIQRYEREQNPLPPMRHETQQRRIEHHRESSLRSHPNRSALENNSSRHGSARSH